MKADTKGQVAVTSTIVPAGATICVVAGLIIRRWWRSRKAPPQFTTCFGLPILGPIIQFLKDPLELIKKGHKKHGECFKVDFLAKDMIFLVGTEGHEFFFTMDKYLDQAKMYSFTIPIFGPKVLYDTDYSTRMCQLRFIRERLTNDCLSSYVGTLEKEVKQFFEEEWPGVEGQVDIRKSMIEALSRTSIRCLMGDELRSKMHTVAKGQTICEMLHTLEQGMLPLSVFMPNAPIPRHRARDAARREMHEFLVPILEERRQKLKLGEVPEDDFLWKVMTSSYPDGRPVSDEEIVGFLVAAFFGGMHNSSITTSWSTLEIFTRPELVAELQQEQKEVLGGSDAPFTFEGYEKMKKLRSVVMETLRMHPPLMLLMRTVEADVEFKKYSIPRGSVVAVSPNVAGMLAECFPEPEEFKPMRFVNGIPNEFAYIPFGGGRRLCKGQEFGFLQIICVVSHMLRMFELKALDGVTKPTIGEGMVIAPSQPCRVHYKRASATA
mmetsp:Transcript_81009/g.224082  ORF Transcript_81009/g.224082 Transcript_81009/m.224082 type:complete len:493 (+) Transcript_81009:91-1569(+)|eukprot:CAMPEP_0179043022 /NCGR_PEP_ID=MMETSP0796-20121207/16956_1 /TAXON_ID=73915 /ORGANISM="Pyrodinium bahamense, Strain pbaha01" /LENGTH=492 /DNA_ID=CAMNT_0020739401 /DNA_START=84 /DNA_END=1562 /DNA_ORIENTATION=+